LIVVLAVAMTFLAGCAHGATTRDTGNIAAPSRAAMQALFEDWVRLWSGNYTGTDQFISADFRLHAALLDGSADTSIHGVAGITRWVQQSRGAFPDLKFTVQVGPLIDGDHLVLRWIANGTYGGGFPGATAAPGTAVTFAGTDILRVEHGKLAEYWVNSDTLLLVSQLGVH
jgi:predicted ester cyclase